MRRPEFSKYRIKDLWVFGVAVHRTWLSIGFGPWEFRWDWTKY